MLFDVFAGVRLLGRAAHAHEGGVAERGETTASETGPGARGDGKIRRPMALSVLLRVLSRVCARVCVCVCVCIEGVLEDIFEGALCQEALCRRSLQDFDRTHRADVWYVPTTMDHRGGVSPDITRPYPTEEPHASACSRVRRLGCAGRQDGRGGRSLLDLHLRRGGQGGQRLAGAAFSA